MNTMTLMATIFLVAYVLSLIVTVVLTLTLRSETARQEGIFDDVTGRYEEELRGLKNKTVEQANHAHEQGILYSQLQARLSESTKARDLAQESANEERANFKRLVELFHTDPDTFKAIADGFYDSGFDVGSQSNVVVLATPTKEDPHATV